MTARDQGTAAQITLQQIPSTSSEGGLDRRGGASVERGRQNCRTLRSTWRLQGRLALGIALLGASGCAEGKPTPRGCGDGGCGDLSSCGEQRCDGGGRTTDATSRDDSDLAFSTGVCDPQPARPAAISHQRTQRSLQVLSAGLPLDISLTAPALTVDGVVLDDGAEPTTVQGDFAQTGLDVEFAALDLGDGVSVQRRLKLWRGPDFVVHKQLLLRLSPPGAAERRLDEIVLERVDTTNQTVRWAGPSSGTSGQTFPALLDGRFFGIEYPVSAMRVETAAHQLVLAHRPGAMLKADSWYESHSAVYGVTAVGAELDGFAVYLADGLAPQRPLHSNYNAWWTLPHPFTSNAMQTLLGTLDTELRTVHGVMFDTVTLDLGWSRRDGIWQIDPVRFPNAFTELDRTAVGLGAHLGLWFSPSNMYSPSSFDSAWAAEAGYETIAVDGQAKYACIAGPKYRDAVEARMQEMALQYHVRQFKFDGLMYVCNEPDHGHAPGDLSREPIVAGLIELARSIREAAPDVWLEAAIFGHRPSPWWASVFDSLAGTYGDDAPWGRVPSPMPRESYTSARDFSNLQGATRLPVPIDRQYVLGVVHQTDEPLANDAVTTVMRGHAFLPFYVNPNTMTDGRWTAVAQLLDWAREHWPELAHTQPILPQSWQPNGAPDFTEAGEMPHEVYGYAHCGGTRALVLLRNPWIANQVHRLRLDAALGLAADAHDLSVRSIYPEPRSYGDQLGVGDAINVPLAPYETIVLSIDRRATQPVADLQPVEEALVGAGEVEIKTLASTGVVLEGEPLGPDWTSVVGAMTEGVKVSLDAAFEIKAPQADLLLLAEGDPAEPSHEIHALLQLDGAELPLAALHSEAAWASTVRPVPERWTFLRATIPQGTHQLTGSFYAGPHVRAVSAWVWPWKEQTRSDGLTDGHSRLPRPERLSLKGATVLAPLDTASVAGKQQEQRPVKRIDGVFVDTLTPVSATQGWGTLRYNESVWEKPLNLSGTPCARGLGTHSPARITYALDGSFSRLQGQVGVDFAVNGSITVEVWADGKQLYASTLLQQRSPPQSLDIDIAGARTLELVVGDAGDGMTSDHADLCDLRLLH